MTDPAPAAAPLILVAGTPALTRTVDEAVEPYGLRVERVESAAAGLERVAGSGDGSAGALVLAIELAGRPDDVESWLDRELGGRPVPILLAVEEPLAQQEYQAWIRAGVWHVLRLPLDPAIFALRLRNLLGGQETSPDGRADIYGPYSWRSMVMVTGEILSLADRYERPISALAFSLDWADPPGHASSRAVIRRLAESAEAAVRDSDIVGFSSDGSVALVVLPDTALMGARVACDRLRAFLERRLKEWGVLASVRLDAVEHGGGKRETAAAFLATTIDSLA
jgi:hypothetical protein